ncbi:MAG: hypothetical protein P8016_11425 [Sedimentisphaerales bacterium]
MNKAAAWNCVAWILAVAAFAGAFVILYRQVRYNIPNDLRTPVILLINALLASIVAIIFALREGELANWTAVHRCLRFGIWTAAVFRLVPLFPWEGVLFMKNTISFDVPYILLAAFIHGGLVFVIAAPFAYSVVGLSALTPDDSLLEMCGATVLIFYIASVVVRLLAEPGIFT